MKKIIIYLSLLFCYLNSGYAGTPVLTLQKTTKVCVPDGVINTDGSEPWGTTWVPMTAKKTTNSVDEISARFQMAFNDSYLWIACEQTGNSEMDTDHTAILNAWDRDNFEVYISMDTTAWANNGNYAEYNNQFRFQRAAEFPWGFDDEHSIGHNSSNFRISQVDAGDGSFIQEWQIPWSGLIAPMTDSGTFDGNYLRFEIQAADNTSGTDGGRNDQIFWRNNSDLEWNDSRTHSLIMLNPPVTGLQPKDSINFISPVSSTVWTAGNAVNIYVYYTIASGSYNYSIGYKKAGGSIVPIKNLDSGGSISIKWNIDFAEEGQYNIVLHDLNASKYYYSDTFTVSPAVPSLAIFSPLTGTIIHSDSKFDVNWSAFNSGNINIEISINSGISWDTLAKNITSNNSFSNSYQATAPTFTSNITNGILKITNISNSLSSQVGNLHFVENIPGTTSPALTIYKTTKTVSPDGVVNTDGSEPWGTTWIPMTAKKTSNSVDEISARFQLAFNDSYLWIACEQTGNSTMDTDHTAILNAWDRDNFEVFISMDTTSWSHNGTYGEYNNQFRMQRAAEFPWSFDDAHHIATNNPDFFVGQVDAGDGSFIQEWKIPWSGLIAPMTDSGTFDGKYLRFEIMAADNTTNTDGGRNDQIFWRNNSDNEWNDSRTHSLIMLDPPFIRKDSINFNTPVNTTIWTAGTPQYIYFYYTNTSGYYDYSISYRKVGGSDVLIYYLGSGGSKSVKWTIDFIEAGKYNIVLHDYNTYNYFYSDTFTIVPSPPTLKLTSPLSNNSIMSGNKFYIIWNAYNSGKINIEISENDGISWDTLARNVISNNSLSNLYQVTAPTFTSNITNGILKITNISNSLYSQVGNLHFFENIPGTTSPALTLHITRKPVSFDGVVNTDGSEPWVNTWIPMTAKKTSNTMDEISARFQLAYNYKYFWIACEQTGNSEMDTDHTAILNAYDRDNFEVFISMDTTSWSHSGTYGEYNNQFRMQRAAEFPWGFDDAHSIGHNNPNFRISQVDAGDGSFVQEWQIPWRGLIAPMTDSGTFDGHYIRFEIHAVDNTTGTTGGRTDQIYWRNNTDNEWNDSRTHSLILMADYLDINNYDQISPNASPKASQVTFLSAFPNPFNDKLEISFSLMYRSKVEIRLYDLLGKFVKTIYSGKLTSGKQLKTLDANELKSGVYLLQLKTSSGIINRMIVKK